MKGGEGGLVGVDPLPPSSREACVCIRLVSLGIAAENGTLRNMT